MTPELKQIRERIHTGGSRRRSQRLIIVGVLLLLMLSSLSRLWHVVETQREVAKLRAQIQSAHLINAQLARQVDLLGSLDYVEKVARDELGLVRPGEIQYLTIRPQEPNR